jgi:NAD(P)-dependent dehydrogenase (short-subunit alcohol dehydrogenase family)
MKKVIIVTGGNRGIGKEICRQLAILGEQVILGCRNKENGLQVAKEIDREIDVQVLDVTNSASIKKLEKYIEKTYGRLDVLINNAGIISSTESVSKSKANDYRKVMDTNLFGPWDMITHFVPLLQKSADPRIINMSSGMGALSELKRGSYAGYRTSKASLNALTIQLAAELKEMKVNAMCPGWVKTDMGGEGADREVAKGAETAVWLATNDKIPSGQFLRDKKQIPW